MKLNGRDTLRGRLVLAIAKGRIWVRRRIPPGWRWPVGLIVFCLGFLGFLPVIGFWMIPLGLAIMAMDLRPAWRCWKAFQKR